MKLISMFSKFVLLGTFFGTCASFASAPAPAQVVGTQPVPFVQIWGGLALQCPEIKANELKINQLKQIVEKIEKGTLRQDDPLIASVLSVNAGPQECECDIFHRANGWRKSFENKILDLLDDPHADKTKPVSYVNYSSGLGFQDLILVTKLIQAGYEDITINLVDNYYGKLIDHANLLQCFMASTELKYNSHARGQGEQTANVVVSLSNYFSLLQHIKKSHVKINLFESADSALKNIKPQSSQLILCADFGKPEELQLSPDQIKNNPFYNWYQSPTFQKPVHSQSFEMQDYFKLAQHVLKNNGYNCALTAQLGERKIDRKINCAKHIMVDDLPCYLYHKSDEPGF